jgi:hypothetical protein
MTTKSNSPLSSFIGQNFWLLMILLFALALRLIYFMGILRGDSVSYAFYAYLMSDDNLAILTEQERYFAGLNRPGLYAPASLFIRLFGASEFSAILFPLFASLITCFFIYKLASNLANKEAGLTAAFLWAIFPLDIFMATQLDPEGPLAMTTAGSVYFLMLANSKEKSAPKIFFYIISTIFIIWAFQIKPSSLPIIFVLFALLLLRYWTGLKSVFANLGKLNSAIRNTLQVGGILAVVLFAAFILKLQPWPQSINNAELSAYDISPAWLLGRSNPISRQDIGRGNYFSLKHNLTTPPAQSNMLTDNSNVIRFNALDAFMPIFLITTAYALINRKRKYYLPIIWFGILFFYLEWGIFPRNFSSEKSLFYLPISHWISADNFLFISVPVLLAISIFISERIDQLQIRKVITSVMIIMLATVFIIQLPSERVSSSNYLGLALISMLVVGGFGASNLSKLHSTTMLQTYLFSSLILFMGIAALTPSTQYHVSGFSKEQERRENLLATVNYLASQPSSPIYSEQGPVNRLNLRAKFEYGYANFVDGHGYPETRFSDDIALIQADGGFTINYGCGQPLKKYDNWPTAEFGNPESEFCISLQRYIPAREINSALSLAEELADRDNSVENLEHYIAASADSKDLGSFVNAVSQMVTLYPENHTILRSSGIIKRYGQELDTNRVTDLLASYSVEGEIIWDFGDLLEASLSAVNGEEILQIEIEKSTQEVQPISLTLNLKSSTAYILEFELTSFAPYDLVRFPNASIPDSYVDSWNRSLSWTKHTVVFVTPSFSELETEASLELARIYDRGDIQFRKITLIEVVPNE